MHMSQFRRYFSDPGQNAIHCLDGQRSALISLVRHQQKRMPSRSRCAATGLSVAIFRFVLSDCVIQVIGHHQHALVGFELRGHRSWIEALILQVNHR
ncbi:hypothetical protein D3C84_1088040 [compost metagenome]